MCTIKLSYKMKNGPSKPSINKEICHDMDDVIQRDKCFYDLAGKINDKSLCEKITGINRNTCLAGYYSRTLDVAGCKSLPNTNFERGNCLKRIALELGDISICEKIDKIHIFYVYCVRTIAIEKKDKTICEQITMEREKRICIENINKAKNK